MFHRKKSKTQIALPTIDCLELPEISTIIRYDSKNNYARLYCTDKSKQVVIFNFKKPQKRQTM